MLPHVEQAQQDKLSMESVLLAHAPSMPEATSTAPLTTPVVLPNAPSTSEASITIFATEFHTMVHTFQTLTTTHIALF